MTQQQRDAVDSLSNAADAARQLYNRGMAIDPGANLSELYDKQNKLMKLWSEARLSVIENDEQTLGAVVSAQRRLEKVTTDVRAGMQNLKTTVALIKNANDLLKAALQLAPFFM